MRNTAACVGALGQSSTYFSELHHVAVVSWVCAKSSHAPVCAQRVREVLAVVVVVFVLGLTERRLSLLFTEVPV